MVAPEVATLWAVPICVVLVTVVVLMIVAVLISPATLSTRVVPVARKILAALIAAGVVNAAPDLSDMVVRTAQEASAA